MQSSKTKTCRKCGATKPLTAEYWQHDRSKRSGFNSTCKTCRQTHDRRRDPIRNQSFRRRLTTAAVSANGRAARLDISGQLTTADLIGIWTRQNGACYWCGSDIRHARQLDHVKPLGTAYFCGDNAPENVVLSCPTCNAQKRDMPPEIFAGRLAARGIRHELLPDGTPVQLLLPDPDDTKTKRRTA